MIFKDLAEINNKKDKTNIIVAKPIFTIAKPPLKLL